MTYTTDGVTIRPVKEEDLYRMWELTFKEENPEWKKWDAPYYPHNTMAYEKYVERKDKIVDQDDHWAIEANGELIGMLSYYWEHKPSLWLEMGILIYEPKYWSGGYGTKALTMWINHLFNEMPLVRVGLTTWSGNKRMIRVAEKLGMTMEARIRKVRYWEGVYYDSIRMGILREEWEQQERS
ncbi:GNAT family protein [Sporosarcina saromensis]|uniref:GNAT family protein n=2 Tax=Sporosarcina saromensis TaxID=359365 RepID=A0ABU4G8E3_9BACL|nr:GNAT family protein [Sporosarcina saromensis]MDW0112583.1 GNAT family protein [Sporosarcina saromensis]